MCVSQTKRRKLWLPKKKEKISKNGILKKTNLLVTEMIDHTPTTKKIIAGDLIVLMRGMIENILPMKIMAEE
jgi:hypothetical protein